MKGKERKSIYTSPFIVRILSKRSDMDHMCTVLPKDIKYLCFTCKLHHACLSFVSVQQMVLPLTEMKDIQLQLTTHLWTSKG